MYVFLEEGGGGGEPKSSLCVCELIRMLTLLFDLFVRVGPSSLNCLVLTRECAQRNGRFRFFFFF